MVTFSLPKSRLMRLRRFFTYLAGPAANGVLLAVILVLVPGHRLYPLDRPPTPLNELGAKWLPDRLLAEFDFVLANAVLLVGNLWPRILSIGGMRLESDGLALLHSCRWRSPAADRAGSSMLRGIMVPELPMKVAGAHARSNGDLGSSSPVQPRGIENRDGLNVLKRSAQICAVTGEQTVED